MSYTMSVHMDMKLLIIIKIIIWYYIESYCDLKNQI